jgi:hypothetical protein
MLIFLFPHTLSTEVSLDGALSTELSPGGALSHNLFSWWHPLHHLVLPARSQRLCHPSLSSPTILLRLRILRR